MIQCVNPHHANLFVALRHAQGTKSCTYLSRLYFQLCALDFKEANLQKDRLPIRERWSSRFASLKQLFAHSQTGKNDRAFKENFSSITVTEGRANVEVVSHEFRSEKRPSLAVSEPEERGEELAELRSNPTFVGGAAPTRKTSRTASFTSMLGSTRSIPATAPLDATDLSLPCPPSTSAVSGVPTPLLPVCSNHGDAYSFHRPATPVPSVHKSTLFSRVLSFLRGMLIPVSLAVIIGIPCAIVLPLKALFVETPGWTGTRMPNAPDGNPPLNFILVTATFLGGMTVPATLVLLGASFARLKVGFYSLVDYTADLT